MSFTPEAQRSIDLRHASLVALKKGCNIQLASEARTSALLVHIHQINKQILVARDRGEFWTKWSIPNSIASQCQILTDITNRFEWEGYFVQRSLDGKGDAITLDFSWTSMVGMGGETSDSDSETDPHDEMIFNHIASIRKSIETVKERGQSQMNWELPEEIRKSPEDVKEIVKHFTSEGSGSFGTTSEGTTNRESCHVSGNYLVICWGGSVASPEDDDEESSTEEVQYDARGSPIERKCVMVVRRKKDRKDED